jgi:hypothetical protein
MNPGAAKHQQLNMDGVCSQALHLHARRASVHLDCDWQIPKKPYGFTDLNAYYAPVLHIMLHL